MRDKWIDLKYDLLEKWDSADKRKLLLVAVLTFFLIGLGLGYANADYRRGQVLQHQIHVCLSKADAVEILTVDNQKGQEAAQEVWNTKQCSYVPVVGLIVGKVVFAARIKRGGEEMTARVVEILQEGKVVAYFLTTEPVDQRPPVKGMDGKPLNLKPDRNS